MNENNICYLYKNCIYNNLFFDVRMVTRENIMYTDCHLLSIVNYSVIYRDIRVLQHLIDIDKSVVNMIGTKLERTPLFFSTDPDITTILIANGSDVNKVDKELNTPLHCILEKYINSTEGLDMINENIKVFIWNGLNLTHFNSGNVSCKDLYHKMFPEENVNDGEDSYIKECMKEDIDLSDDGRSDGRSDINSSIESLI